MAVVIERHHSPRSEFYRDSAGMYSTVRGSFSLWSGLSLPLTVLVSVATGLGEVPDRVVRWGFMLINDCTIHLTTHTYHRVPSALLPRSSGRGYF